MSKMWSGRFNANASTLLDQFNASLPFDKELYLQDIQGSIAHATMLAKQGILSQEEAESIIHGLKTVKEKIENGQFEWNIEDEDIHMAIEKALTNLIGDAGKKLHTARSRNDQVALDFRLYVQQSNKDLIRLLANLMQTLINIAKNHTQTLIPGMTHLQHAQPISFAYHLLAYASMFKRDIERFQSSFERNNYSPIGCAALAGTPHPIDREMTAQELGFDAPTINCLDTVSDRDFALEILFNIATMFMHISRLSEELILWSSYEFGFVTLSDEYSTGSSIMPQKKNPDVPELLRGKTGRAYGNLMALLTVMKGLPLAYNKDMQEDKEGVFDSVKNAKISLEILNETLKTMNINKEKMEAATKIGHLTATDLADYLVEKIGIPFREAHFITGKAVALAEQKQKDLSELSLAELQSIDPRIQNDVLQYLDLQHSMNARNSYGGTAKEQVEKQIEYFERFLEELEG
ncbi:argininosuccinate lyase [Nitratiruptor sp. SB155-2]|uniref:Argininosuccinate lyase n=1 Tax=Nitratiruptor sp. (strain SB155-2) TaxID=387092 RepID=ARLY_NITSB|nr:argininosuccinate lyase [Nitratiruptor sp. SB155-2]A6Q2R2.1 RecName: Full=Argininosuccinate lyase; Short=ASAL; AltName: Full=Arginosuccinase [Nitratiruptor sp. SB155-2]BAF69771.1 argininosuccinate lyase [Nitratiruptor sp. SB155-2]